MRIMHITPANRRTVYQVVVGQWGDGGGGVGLETVATRSKLSEEAALSVLTVLVEAGTLKRVGKDPDHPIWIPATHVRVSKTMAATAT